MRFTHPRGYAATDLVVDGIEWKRQVDDSATTWGGRLRVWGDWEPEDNSLRPRKFAYFLPPDRRTGE